MLTSQSYERDLAASKMISRCFLRLAHTRLCLRSGTSLGDAFKKTPDPVALPFFQFMAYVDSFVVHRFKHEHYQAQLHPLRYNQCSFLRCAKTNGRDRARAVPYWSTPQRFPVVAKHESISFKTLSEPTSRPGFSATVSGIRYIMHKVVMPADTDYSGAMWHGAYIRWLEEARVRYFADIGIDYSALVNESRVELVVAGLSLRYIRPAKHGEEVTLTQRLAYEQSSRVRMITESTFHRSKDGVLLATASVTVSPIDARTGRIVRKWPADFEKTIIGLFGNGGEDSPNTPDWLLK